MTREQGTGPQAAGGRRQAAEKAGHSERPAASRGIAIIPIERVVIPSRQARDPHRPERGLSPLPGRQRFLASLGMTKVLGMTCVFALACNRGESAERSGEKAIATPSASQTAQAAADGPRGTLPNDMCQLIPVADVEAILGKLTGPPKGGKETCKYPLPMDEETAKSRAGYQQMARDINAKSAAANDTTMNSVAVIVTVDMRGDMTFERGGKIAGTMLANMFAQVANKNGATIDTSKRADEPKRPEGWDRATSVHGKSDFRGRIGHLVVSVDENSDLINAVPSEKKAALAARVRDRITDLPFVFPFAGPQTGPPPEPDPCSLVTREEAEAVLGKLLAPPYRAHDGGPYAKPHGSSCGYYTAGHHVFVVTPSWTRGKQHFEIIRGVGTLVTSVAADPDREKADTLDGPWDDVVLGLDGTLAFLKGDQLLEVEYLTSSTDAAGAVRLARVALKRLASKASGT